MTRRWVALLLVGCGDPAAIEAEESGGETTFMSSTSGATPGSDTSTTTSLEPAQCVARRYSLLDDEQCMQAAIGDLDADGHADLFVMPGPAQGFIASEYLHRLHTFRGGAAELQAPELHCCVDAYQPTSLGLFDVNGDGRMDPLYALAHSYSSSDVVSTIGGLDLLVRGPVSGFLPDRTVAQVGPSIATGPPFTIGTLLASQRAVVVGGADLELHVLVADELSLVSTPAAPLALSGYPLALATTDLDGDGVDDVVALTQQRIELIRSVGDATLTPFGFSMPPILGTGLLVGDVDGIGGRDIVIVGEDGVAVGLVTPDAITWHAQPEIAITSPSSLVDLDLDSVVDLVTVDGSTLVAHRGSSEGMFSTAAAALSQGVGDDVRTIVAGDLDGDARADLVVCDGLGVLVVSIADAL